MAEITPSLAQSPPPQARGYLAGVNATCAHALQLMFRRQRLILAFVIALLPVLLPVATAMFSSSQFAQEGNKIFVELVEKLQINSLAPLLALFFATMLIGEEVEGQTMIYILTRPLARSAWVIGRYIAYVIVASLIMITSIALTFASSTTLVNFGFSWVDIQLMLHYQAVGIAAIMVYGAFTMFLGAFTRWPIVIGVVILYGWQKLASSVPGVVDFLTIQKYTTALLPVLPTQRSNEAMQAIISGFQREEFLIGATKAGVVLGALTIFFILLTIYTVLTREYARGRAIGA